MTLPLTTLSWRMFVPKSFWILVCNQNLKMWIWNMDSPLFNYRRPYFLGLRFDRSLKSAAGCIYHFYICNNLLNSNKLYSQYIAIWWYLVFWYTITTCRNPHFDWLKSINLFINILYAILPNLKRFFNCWIESRCSSDTASSCTFHILSFLVWNLKNGGALW
jgi:hypothetical protein